MTLWDFLYSVFHTQAPTTAPAAAVPPSYTPPARKILVPPTPPTDQTDPDERFQHFTEGFILKWECDWPEDKSGQYSNTPGDDGGPTKWGIDLTSQKENHPDQGWTASKIKALSETDAVTIYKEDYWDKYNISSQPYPIGECMYNTYVNGGHATDWAKESGGDALKYISLMEAWYNDLADSHPNDKQFLKGWLNRSEDLKTFLGLASNS